MKCKTKGVRHAICSGHNEGRGISSELCFLPRLIHDCQALSTRRGTVLSISETCFESVSKGPELWPGRALVKGSQDVGRIVLLSMDSDLGGSDDCCRLHSNRVGTELFHDFFERVKQSMEQHFLKVQSSDSIPIQLNKEP